MTQTFFNIIAHWIHENPAIALIACFMWGVGSVLLSPCHLATVSILATPRIATSTVKYKIHKLMFGHIVALFITGLILILFSYELDILGHYWTVPFGFLFLYLAWQLLQTNHCSHCDPNSMQDSVLEKFLQKIAQNSLGFFNFGFVYGLLSSTCVLIFLAPVLVMAKSLSMQMLILFNLAFAIGHTLPIFIMAMLANSIHKLSCHSDGIFKLARRIAALCFTCIAVVLIAHPFLELMGFDFHGHDHGSVVHDHSNFDSHNHDSHNHDSHNHDSHEHDSHEHDSHNHDSHDHDSHDHSSHEHDQQHPPHTQHEH